MKKGYIIYLVPLLMLIICSVMLIRSDFNHEINIELLMLTARVSFLLFTLAFSASFLNNFFGNKFTSWLLQNRKHVGIAFALNHYVHFGLLALAERGTDPIISARSLPSMGGGFIAYLVMTAMFFTSFDFIKKKMNKNAWRKLHLYGGYFILFIFTASYVKHIAVSISYLPLLLLAIMVWVMRIMSYRTLARKKT